jgi:hypothetical protein
MIQKVYPKRRYVITNLRCLPKNSKDLSAEICFPNAFAVSTQRYSERLDMSLGMWILV